MIALMWTMSSNDQVERRGGALPATEADLSQSSILPWLNENWPRDRSNRLLGVNCTACHLASAKPRSRRRREKKDASEDLEG
jgi:hypothetical protein